MPFRMYDFACTSCPHRWEELITVTSAGEYAKPRCPQCRGAFGRQLIAAPAIRTADNIPREMRLRNTAGHLQGGAVEAPIYDENRKVIGKQLVEPQTGLPIDLVQSREFQSTAISAKEFEERYLSNPEADAGPAPDFCDNRENLSQVLEDAEEMWQRAESGTLPPVERPLTETMRAAEGVDPLQVVTTQASDTLAQQSQDP